jgi:hypothetical protein
MTNDFEIDDSVKDISDDLNSISLELEYCGNTIDSNRHSESNLRKKAMETFQLQMMEMRKDFDHLEKQTGEKIEEIGNRNQATLDNAVKLHEKLQNKISKIKSDLEVRNLNENPAQLFTATMDYKIKQEIASEIEDLKQKSKVERYNYVPSSDAGRILQRLQLGNIHIKTSEQQKGFIFCFSLDIFAGNEKDHAIPELVIVNDTFIVAWDKKTKSIIAIDTVNRCITSKLTGIPATCFTRINENQFAVSIPDKQMIQFINLSQSGILSLGCDIIIKDEHFVPYGLRYCNGVLIAACHSHVRVLDMDGNEIRIIANNSTGAAMFNAAFCVAASPDNETIYILDYYSFSNCPSLTSMTLDGKVKAVFKDKNLVKPHALSVDRNGSIYVHCQGTPNIHMLSADCNKVQEITLPSLCFAFSMKSNIVYVGTDHGIDKYITN